jgi:hypothetical protein
MRSDDTSSFPSRAVTCSVVFTFAISYGIAYMTDTKIFHWWVLLGIIFATLLSSFARVHLGVHYPSDCLGGFLQGALICLLGTALWDANVWGCTSCHYGQCYATDEQHAIMGSYEAASGEHLGEHLNFLVLFVGTAICIALFFVSVIRPLVFWEKCDRVYGVLLACVVFQLAFLCPPASLNGSSLPPPKNPGWASYFMAVVIPILILPITYFAGKKFKGTMSVIVFFVLFVPLLVVMSLWRLFVLGFDWENTEHNSSNEGS